MASWRNQQLLDLYGSVPAMASGGMCTGVSIVIPELNVSLSTAPWSMSSPHTPRQAHLVVVPLEPELMILDYRFGQGGGYGQEAKKFFLQQSEHKWHS